MLTTITLILVLLTLGFGVFTFSKISSLKKENEKLNVIMDSVRENLLSLNRRVQALETHKASTQPKIEESYYDSETNTLVIKGNLKAEGWISAGKNKS